jgi:hypothetical protein
MLCDLLKALAGGALVSLWLCGVAFAHQSPDCTYIRAQVKQHGKIKAIAWALANGYSPSEIARIRKVCGV